MSRNWAAELLWEGERLKVGRDTSYKVKGGQRCCGAAVERWEGERLKVGPASLHYAAMETKVREQRSCGKRWEGSKVGR